MRLAGRRMEMVLVGFWALLTGASLAHTLSMLDNQVREVAAARARMLFSIIETTRLWNASHGGLYAPVTEATPPNPYLDDPGRDVIIDGQPYTKINPAYMTRQISELVERQKGISFHITSLKPIRPANAPDPWEAHALTAFETGAEEMLDETDFHGRAAFRYMAKLRVTQACMPCHAQQGYKVGDVRGGISVTMAADHVRDEVAPQRRHVILLHLAGFGLLSGGTLMLLGRLRHSWRRLDEALAAREAVIAERTAALTAANAELERSNAELENFAYVASHDLQEPLRMMGGYAQLIARRYGGQIDDDGREFLGYMAEGAERMKAMIDDLLDYSRVDRGEPARAVVDMNLALDSALANLAAAIAEAGAEVGAPAPLPSVWGESALLARLMQNLVGNAVKYHRPGERPRVTVTAEPTESGWIFTVADNGIGIPADSRERVFQIFQRLHARGSYPGTGIGLAICKKIVERHGGRIWVEDGPGGGSAFRFTLPAA
ncbi:MAG: ATP-binding protein [Pseudomonadota bacterium]